MNPEPSFRPWMNDADYASYLLSEPAAYWHANQNVNELGRSGWHEVNIQIAWAWNYNQCWIAVAAREKRSLRHYWVTSPNSEITALLHAPQNLLYLSLASFAFKWKWNEKWLWRRKIMVINSHICGFPVCNEFLARLNKTHTTQMFSRASKAHHLCHNASCLLDV